MRRKTENRGEKDWPEDAGPAYHELYLDHHRLLINRPVELHNCKVEGLK